MDYKEAVETASKLLAYAKETGLPEEIRAEMHAAAIMLFGVEEALRAEEVAEVRAEKAERERDAIKAELDYYKYPRQHQTMRFGFSEKEK